MLWIDSIFSLACHVANVPEESVGTSQMAYWLFRGRVVSASYRLVLPIRLALMGNQMGKE